MSATKAVAIAGGLGLFLIAIGCDQSQRAAAPSTSPTVASSPLGAATPIPTAVGSELLPSPVVVSPGPTSPTGWSSFHSTLDDFTIMYPLPWHNLIVLGQAGDGYWFANENVDPQGGLGLAEQLSRQGVLFSIGVERGYTYCYGDSIGVTRRVQFEIDGVDGILSETTLGPPVPYWWMVIKHGGYCYSFRFTFNRGADLSVIHNSELIEVAILSTFRFGSPPAP